MEGAHTIARRRWKRHALGLAILAVHLGLLFWLTLPSHLRTSLPEPAMTIIPIALPPPQVEATPAPKTGSAEPEAAASRPAPEAKPPPTPAPEPDVPVAAPSVVQMAPAPGAGKDSTAGAATAGDGLGAGLGNGIGTGQSGFGTGGGGGVQRAKLIAGDITAADYPDRANRARREGTVIVHFDVTADGRVERCRVVRSSGDLDLDTTTCRLAEARLRYAPARNARGEAVSDIAGWKQDWWLEQRR